MRPKMVGQVLQRALIATALGLAWTTAGALQVPGPLVETAWLAEHAAGVVILDVREDATSYLESPSGSGRKPTLASVTGHIPAAVSVPWKKLVTTKREGEAVLKAMLPSPEAFTETMQGCGVDHDSAVVVAGRGTSAKDQAVGARLYFTLKYFGHDNVALLDGGTAQWAKEGRPLVYTRELPEKGNFFVAETRGHLIANTQDVKRAIESADVQLVDCRTEEFYFGLNFKPKLVSPEYRGHLSGAKTLPFVLIASNSAPARLFAAQDLHDIAALKDVDLDAATIVYCNTGVTGSLGWFALRELLGNEHTRLYDGSMHAWSHLGPAGPVVSLAELVNQAAADERKWATAQGKPPGVVGNRPLSLQTIVGERRDALRRRRNLYFDTMSGRRHFQPAWIAAREQMIEDYRERLRAAHRQHRDALRYYQDTMRARHDPVSSTRSDWLEYRHFQAQMERLDRQGLRDALRFTRPRLP